MHIRLGHLALPLVLIAAPHAAQPQEKLLIRKELPLRVEIEAAQAAIDACAAKHVAIHVYVVDRDDNVKLLLIGDGAHWDTLTGARRKAHTAVTLGVPTIEMAKKLAADPNTPVPNDPQLVFLGGGVPIRVGGELIGALSVGGGAPEQDAVCAQQGVDKIQPYLQ